VLHYGSVRQHWTRRRGRTAPSGGAYQQKKEKAWRMNLFRVEEKKSAHVAVALFYFMQNLWERQNLCRRAALAAGVKSGQ